MSKILIVDDDFTIKLELEEMLTAIGHVMKPFDEKEISAVVEIAIYKREMELKLKGAQQHLS